MAEVRRTGDLESDKLLRMQKRVWKFHRIGKWTLGLFLAAALAGFLGGGPLSRGVAGKKGEAIWAEYERFARHDASGELKVHVRGDQVRDGKVRVWMGKEWVEAMEVEEVMPPPVEVEGRGDRYIYTFAAAGDGEVLIVFSLKVKQAGAVKGKVGLEGGPETDFRQYILP